MNSRYAKRQALPSPDSALLQEIIRLRACLHQMGLHARDEDILLWLSAQRKTQLAREAPW